MIAAFVVALCAALPFASATVLESLDFEHGSNWGSWQLQIQSGEAKAIVVSPGYKSNHAGAFSISNATDQFLMQSPLHSNLVPGLEYTWSADVKLNSPNCFVLLQNFDGILSRLDESTNGLKNNTWSHVSVSWIERITNDQYSIATLCDIPNSGIVPEQPVVEFDNILIKSTGTKIYTNTTTPTGGNLVKQPNFESGTFGPWKKLIVGNESTVTITSPGYNGSAHAAFANLSAPGPPGGAIEIAQTVPGTKLNGVYKLSIYWRIPERLNYFCAGETLMGSSQYPLDTVYYPYQSVSLFPQTQKDIPPVGEWRLEEGLLQGLSDDFRVLVNFNCDIGGSSKFEFGDIQLVPLS